MIDDADAPLNSWACKILISLFWWRFKEKIATKNLSNNLNCTGSNQFYMVYYWICKYCVQTINIIYLIVKKNIWLQFHYPIYLFYILSNNNKIRDRVTIHWPKAKRKVIKAANYKGPKSSKRQSIICFLKILSIFFIFKNCFSSYQLKIRITDT